MAEVFALTIPGGIDGAPFAAVLDDGERARADRFVHERDRLRFVVAHGLLRAVLARALRTAPSALRFATGRHGRPRLEPDKITFSLAHSGDQVLVALGEGETIGVDVEIHRPLPDLDRLLGVVATAAERAAIEALTGPARPVAFFDLWTRKEALAKALGLGLSLPLGTTGAPAGRAFAGGRTFRIDQVALGPGLSAAVARPPADDQSVVIRSVAVTELETELRRATRA